MSLGSLARTMLASHCPKPGDSRLKDVTGWHHRWLTGWRHHAGWQHRWLVDWRHRTGSLSDTLRTPQLADRIFAWRSATPRAAYRRYRKMVVRAKGEPYSPLPPGPPIAATERWWWGQRV